MPVFEEAGVPGLPLDRFREYFDRVRPGGASGPLRARVVEGGRSNLTYEVTDGRSAWIVRRPPLGHVLATAHDMAREYRVMTALAGTAVPVPATYALCEAPDVLGAPFYVMEKVEGVPYRSAAELAPLGPDRVARIAERMLDTLVDLHGVDPAAVGLAGFGRPEGFLARQVRRWKKQLDASRSRDLPAADELHALLAANTPPGSAPAIVHGDYRLDNLLVDSRDRIAAVLDWEMATLGDPLTDLALLLVYLGRGAPAPGGRDASSAPGFPGPDEVVARYAARSGRDVSSIGFYVALACFKLAVISEGIHYRYLRGQTVGEGFGRVGATVEPLLRAGLAALRDGSPPPGRPRPGH
ncbi:Predicted kinase, aminoglycoside phosphotransferase (APT) family [Actinomadura meyerae]|uniref:Predicted kinase, aminoglycoside phosphotransferase (APT) family n=1 Tax=Actinomadura meyerae TaxID=240840 RepID=A0A239LGT6_9ACTN|nr:phosphotransferase family protein [Actinomadura meyerae]SNT29575.1 Predicted kinase, aminoglycoside phosphotransferase (APT) family [Actinomadura meyerae]